MPTLHRRAAAALFALTAAAVLGDTTAAKAGLLASATRTALISGGGAAVFLPLTDNNSVTTLTFSTTAPNETVVFRYNAECEASTPGWVSVGVFVDGTQTFPAVLRRLHDVQLVGWRQHLHRRAPPVGLHRADGRHSHRLGEGRERVRQRSLAARRHLPDGRELAVVELGAKGKGAALADRAPPQTVVEATLTGD